MTATRTPGISSAVLGYLRQQCGKEVHYSDIMASTGFSQSQVTSAIAHLRSVKQSIVSPLKGWYVFDDCDAAGDEPIVSVGATGTVVSILRDGRPLLSIDGRLFIAEELTIDV